MKVIVSNIQRFCLHDGPGIRTTVFLKGCSLRCPWCSNPENINFNIQEYEYDGIKSFYGKEMDLEEIEKEILKDEKYYANGGGVTFSGGECLLFFKKLEPLLKNLNQKKINICIETALNVPEEFVDIAIKYVDEFYVDLKILCLKDASKINIDVDLYKKNIKKIFENKCNVTFRIPLVPEYTSTKENINEIIKLLKEYKPKKVEIFKTHKLAYKKYQTLGLKMINIKEITKEEIDEIKREIKKLGIETIICKI